MEPKSNQFFKNVFGTYFPWILYIIALGTTYYHVSVLGMNFWVSYLKAVVFFNGGIQGLWAAAAHLFFPEPTAKQIGWAPSGFQTEMGATNLALGITGILTWWHPAWRLPLALCIAVIFAGCAYAHIRDRIVNKNAAPCNTGPMLYNTILVSVTLFITFLIRYR